MGEVWVGSLDAEGLGSVSAARKRGWGGDGCR